MKKISWVFVNTALIITIVLMVTFHFFVQKMETSFLNYYSKQLDNYSRIIRRTVDMAASYTNTYDQLLTDDLYYKLSALNQDLKNIPLDALNDELLQIYKEKYDLYGLAIFARKEEGIFIHNSTIKGEIGTGTSDWGYWNEAFHSLFQGQQPTIDKGVTRDNFWIGPRSRSYHMPGFYRFAYYYNEHQDYLINGFIEDNNAYNVHIKNLLDELFAHFNEDISYIESISLIDLAAWEKAFYNNFKNPEDPAFIYGNFNRDLLIHSKLTPHDLYAIEGNKSLIVNYQGRDKAIFLISAGTNEYKYMIAVSIDDHDIQRFRRQAGLDFALLTLFTITSVLLGVFYIMKKYSTILTFQIERNDAIEKFTKNIAALPEFVYKCTLDNNGNLLLTYNDGKFVSKDKYVALESNYLPMTEVYPPEYVMDFKAHIVEVFDGDSKKFEITYHGEHYEHFVSPILDENKKVVEIIGFATNITDRRIAEERSKYAASHDGLTGLINRMAFEEQVQEEIEHYPDHHYALMFLDLDKFKQLNDTFGHIVGDCALQEIANRIRTIVASSKAFVARMGGDEFAIFLSYTHKQEVIIMAQEIIHSISQPCTIKDDEVFLGVSIGISLYNEDSTIYKQLIHFADMAMYEAKNCTGSSYAFFSEKMLEKKNAIYEV